MTGWVRVVGKGCRRVGGLATRGVVGAVVGRAVVAVAQGLVGREV